MSLLRAVFVGDGSLLIRCAEIYSRDDNFISGVVTSNGLVADWARRAGIPVFDWPKRGNPALGSIEYEYLFSIANLRIVPREILARAHCAINFHDSLLPAFAGLNATSWAIMAGETRHGISWHEITAEIDSGRILRQQSFPLTPEDTAFTVNAKCYEAAAESFEHLIEDLRRGRVELVAQTGTRSYFGRADRPSAAATIDFSGLAAAITALVRALDFGTYPNPLGRPKLYLGNDIMLVRSVEVVSPAPSAPPGRLVSLGKDRLVMSCTDADICFAWLTAPDGSTPQELLRRNGLDPGRELPTPSPELLEKVTRYDRHAASFETSWSREFAQLRPTTLPYPRSHDPTSKGALPQSVILSALAASPWQAVEPERVAAAFVAWIALVSGAPSVSLLYTDSCLAEAARGMEAWFSPVVPLTIRVQGDRSPDAVFDELVRAIHDARRAGPYSRDLPFRMTHAEMVREALGALRIGIDLSTGDRSSALDRCDVVFSVDPERGCVTVGFPRGEFAEQVSRTIARHVAFFLGEFLEQHSGSLRDVPLMPPEERAAITYSNRTTTALPDSRGLTDEIACQMHRTPRREAIRWGEQTLDYAALDARVGVIAGRLLTQGAGRGTIVGIHLERTPDLVAAVLATLSVGAAYLPLDPAYPAERIRFMVEDSGAQVILTNSRLDGRVAHDGAKLVKLDDLPSTSIADGDGKGLARAITTPDDLAYVIYTSGSTGRPKGVMVTHRNMLNFFAGMDAVVPHKDGGRWLAVTSLSFDISVLELLWTLARGFTVVLHSNAPGAHHASRAELAFSLFYFSSDEGSEGTDKYRLLFEGAKFADREGLAAVWTPERHFHAFGGLFPNSAITSAAIAAVTQRVAIRAGSCVLPLHNPIRAAEDWALVDNISKGRIGVSLASGWQPNDFVIAPDAFADRKDIMIKGIETLRRLWRGEKLSLRNPNGDMVAIGTVPRPIQREIPLWLTAAGNPETFRQAGELGCGVLTHLLGQSLDDIAEKIGLYRRTRQQAGHTGKGHVTLMLHTFIGESDDLVRETVRQPMKEYLRSSVDLIRIAAWSFPTFIQRATAAGRKAGDPFDASILSDAEMDAVLDHAFERYFSTSGLFGTVERCLEMVRRLTAIGVDEIACLIDFGVVTEQVLASLPRLKQLMDAAGDDRNVHHASVAKDVATHRISHLQCTPSMASMLVADAAGRAALASLDVLLVGGEVLPVTLAKELRRLEPGKLLNMYGPTETTVWSSVCELQEIGDFVSLGAPIANTSLRVLDSAGRECPALVPGELYIGGAGVARGYLNRPELTAERFIRDPFDEDSNGRLYRTGDLVRRHPDGMLEFVGRMDNQVKIRGHRIELGEIETLLTLQSDVKDAVVVARPEGAGYQDLIAYVTPRVDRTLDGQALRQRLAALLPEIMVPARVVVLSALPLTPNGKVDRAALPAAKAVTEPMVAATPEGETDALIASIWCELLGLPSVSRTANFFDLGGHSLLVIQVQRRLLAATGHEIPIVEMFRHPTIRALAQLIDGRAPTVSAVDRGVERACMRRALLQRRA